MVCFMHDDHRPSLDIYADRNFCICRSCGWKADVIGAYMAIELLKGNQLTFSEAVRQLAALYNIPVQETPKDPKYAAEMAENKKQTTHAFALHSAVAEAYEAHLHRPIGQGAAQTTAFDYFEARGIKPETMAVFKLGGVPHTSNELIEHLTQSDYTIEEVEKYHLFRQNRNRDWQSPIHDRVVYPLQNHMGEVVGFAGRKLPNPDCPEADKIQKYINSEESNIYHKHQLLYGMYQAHKAIVMHQQSFIVEGYQDVLAMHQAGIRETVAVCGTALTKEQVRLLRRYGDRTMLMLDGDAAGQKAMLRHLEVLLQAGMYVDVVALPGGQDPDEFIQSKLGTAGDASAAELRESLLAAFAPYQRSWLAHCCVLLEDCDAKALRTAQGVVFDLLGAISERVRQETAIGKAARLMGLGVDTVTVAVADAVNKKKTASTQSNQASSSATSKGSEATTTLGGVDASCLTPRQQAERNLVRHLVLYGTYRGDDESPESALAYSVYKTLQDEGIALQNRILQDMLEVLYKGYTDWVAATGACEELGNRPYLLVSALQGADSKQICTCATRIYEKQMERELTFGESACPSTKEVLKTAGHYMEVLKKAMVQEQIAELSKLAEELLTAEVVDEGRYREVMREMKRHQMLGV